MTMKYAIKVRVQTDFLYELDADTQEEAEEQAIEMAHTEIDNGSVDYSETYSAAVQLEGEKKSMYDRNVSIELDTLIHSQV